MNSSIGGPGGPGGGSNLTQLAARLGTAAGRLSSAAPPTPAAPFALSPALLALLHSLQRRNQAHEHLKATHFIDAD